MKTDLTFIRDIINNQIAGYESEIKVADSIIRYHYSEQQIIAERISALQHFKASLINFIADANKLTEKK